MQDLNGSLLNGSVADHYIIHWLCVEYMCWERD